MITEKQFNKLSRQQQWQWVLNNKNSITLELDNDETLVVDDNTDEGNVFYLKADIGNRDGVIVLLRDVLEIEIDG